MANDTLPVVASGGKTPEMVERVARAIAASVVANSPLPDLGYVFYLDDARAAIAAMREPTEAMLASGGNAGYWNDNAFEYDVEARDVWHAMIDAALSE